MSDGSYWNLIFNAFCPRRDLELDPERDRTLGSEAECGAWHLVPPCPPPHPTARSGGSQGRVCAPAAGVNVHPAVFASSTEARVHSTRASLAIARISLVWLPRDSPRDFPQTYSSPAACIAASGRRDYGSTVVPRATGMPGMPGALLQFLVTERTKCWSTNHQAPRLWLFTILAVFETRFCFRFCWEVPWWVRVVYSTISFQTNLTWSMVGREKQTPLIRLT